jgi:hypothetical protein
MVKIKISFYKKIILSVSAFALGVFNLQKIEYTNAQVNRDDLNLLFRYTMGRGADEGDMKFWGNSSNLTVPLQIIPDSEEYKNAMKPYIVDMYLTLLGRYPDYEGARNWNSAGPMEIYRSIKKSVEYRQTQFLQPNNFLQYGDEPCVESGVVLKEKSDLDILFNSESMGFSESSGVLQNEYIYNICAGKTAEKSILEVVEIKNLPAVTEIIYTVRQSDDQIAGHYPSVVFSLPKTGRQTSFRYTDPRFLDQKNKFLNE